MTTYIQFRYRGQTETIDEMPTRREAAALLAEYRQAYGGEGALWLSSRACGNWDAVPDAPQEVTP